MRSTFFSALVSGTVFFARNLVESIDVRTIINAYYIYCNEIDPKYLPVRSSRRNDDIIHVVNFNELRRIKKPIFEYDDFWLSRRPRHIASARDSFCRGDNTLFLGAGLSQSIGYPSWDGLLNALLKRLMQKRVLSVNDHTAFYGDTKNDPLLKARYLKSFYDDCQLSMVSEIRSVFSKTTPQQSPLLDSVVAMIKTGRIGSVITYNYDDILENALAAEYFSFTPVDCSNRPITGSLPINHIHGFIAHEREDGYDSNVVLSEDDYHGLYDDANNWANVEQLHALSHTCCFFVGLSMTDPDLRRLLDISFTRGTGEAIHYAFLPRKEYKQPAKAESLFYRMGINVIWFQDFDELPRLIMDISARK